MTIVTPVTPVTFNLFILKNSVSRFILRFFAFNPAHYHNMQDLGILEVDFRVLELDLRFRGGLGLSQIGLGLSPPLNLDSNSRILNSHCKPSDFRFFRWTWVPKSIFGAEDLDAGGVLLLKTSTYHHLASPRGDLQGVFSSKGLEKDINKICHNFNEDDNGNLPLKMKKMMKDK